MKRAISVVTPPHTPPTQAALFDPTTHRPLCWTHLPTIGTALTIAGMPGVVWAYVGPVEYGRDYRAVCLVRWHERANRYAERVVAPAGWVLEEVARTEAAG